MRAQAFSTSDLIIGIIEDVDISKIQSSRYSVYRHEQYALVDELMISIKNKGLLQPIIVRTISDGYEIVAGNRRLSACKSLGWKKILCHVVSLSDKEAYEISLTENIQRRSMSVLEEAEAFSDYVVKFGWGGVSELASRVGKSTSYVDKRIKLRSLPKDVLESLANSSINTAVAEELIYLDKTEIQSRVAKLAKEKGLSSRDVRTLVCEFREHASRTSDDLIYNNSDEINDTEYEGIYEIDKRTQRIFDKAIVTFRTAMNKIIALTESVEDNWILYEILMQHKNVLHQQIDLIMKEKKKI